MCLFRFKEEFCRLCTQAKELAEARERMEWHEQMSRRNIESSEVLQVGNLPSDPAFLNALCLSRGSWPVAVGTEELHVGLLLLQERRVIEYVSLGDFQTAVGFLLASTPEKSIRYYRDALCTLALAVQPPLFYKVTAVCLGIAALALYLSLQAYMAAFILK